LQVFEPKTIESLLAECGGLFSRRFISQDGSRLRDGRRTLERMFVKVAFNKQYVTDGWWTVPWMGHC
jgi:hypothetical protein